MLLGKFLEDFVSKIKLERPSHGYYQVSFEDSDENVTTKKLLKEEFESDELLLMILGYIDERNDGVIDNRVTRDLPWLFDYLISNGYLKRETPITFVELLYNSGSVVLPSPTKEYFGGSKKPCLEYITSLYENY